MPDRSDEFRAAAGSCHFIPITEPRRRDGAPLSPCSRKERPAEVAAVAPFDLTRISASGSP
jgi:hypothetical protein